MSIWIEEIEFTQENEQASTFIDYLGGNIFQKINLRIQFRSEWHLKPTTLDYLYFADPSLKTSDWLTFPTNLNGFADLNVDDTIIFDSGGTSTNNQSYIISEKPNNYQIRLTTLAGATPTLAVLKETAGQLDLIQDPKGMTLDFGLIENDEAVNFDSKVDQSLMRYELGVLSGFLPVVSTPALAVGKLDWQLGSCELTNLTSTAERDAYTYQYEFNQVLYIHPFYLPEQILDIKNTFPKAPKYFKKEKCLRYVARIRAYRELQDPNVFQEGIIDDKIGQTGWFNEEFNGGTHSYSASNFAYSNTIGAIDPRQVTSISFNVDTNPTIVTGAADWVTLNFIVLPEKDNDFKNRNQYQQENYVFDRAHQQQGAALINGEQFGGGYQVFKNVTVTFVSATQVTVAADIEFGSDAIDKINTLSNGGYLIAAYAHQNLEPADSYHATTMLLDVNEMQTEISDDIVDVSTVFLYHDQNDTSVITGGATVKVEDEIVAESLILLDQTTSTGYPDAQIDSFSSQIVAKKTGEDDVILLEQDFLVSGNAMQGTVRSLNVSPVTGFDVNSSEIRHNFRAYRSPTDDVGSEFGYRVQYPFLYRWEYWEQQILNTLPLDWYDSAEQFNGYNEEWFRIQGLTGWDIYHRLESIVTFDGVTSDPINNDTLITPQNYLAGSNWTTESITAFDDATALTYSGSPYIMQNKQTTIKANFTDASGLLLVGDVYMVARLIPKEGGTYIANESLSSVYNRENGGLFIGNSSGLIDISLSGAVFTGTFDIDYTKIPTGMLDYTLSVSIGVDSAAAMTDFGEVQLQNMKVLEVIDFTPPEIPKDPNPFIKCCYPLTVFGDLTDKTDEYQNDFSSPLMIFPLQYTVTMKLEKLVDDVWTSQTTLVDNTFGTYYVLGFESKNNKNYVGYKIDWAEVLDTGVSGFGTGKYRLNFETSSGSLYSEEYCLEQFTLYRADNTVRIQYNWNSIIGDENQAKTRDFVGLNWDNQVRLNDAIFGNKSAAFATDDVRYQSGELRTVSKSFNEKYIFTLKRLPVDIFNLFLYDILLSDEILISDYNKANFAEYVNHSVEIEGEISPDYSQSRPEVSITATFKSKYDNNIKYFS